MKNNLCILFILLLISFTGCRGCKMKSPSSGVGKSSVRIKLPQPKSLPPPPRTVSKVNATLETRNAFNSAKIEFKIYSSSGRVVGHSTINSSKSISAAYKMKYEKNALEIIDKTFKKIDLKKIKSEKDLDVFIAKTIAKELKSINSKPRLVEGKLTFEGSLKNGESLSYTVDIVDAIKAGLIISGGYYIVKKLK